MEIEVFHSCVARVSRGRSHVGRLPLGREQHGLPPASYVAPFDLRKS
jgi:hypothetical protein